MKLLHNHLLAVHHVDATDGLSHLTAGEVEDLTSNGGSSVNTLDADNSGIKGHRHRCSLTLHFAQVYVGLVGCDSRTKCQFAVLQQASNVPMRPLFSTGASTVAAVA